ncbi:MAG: hypothetical protein LRY41_02015 [Candidatus Pacebacteria bacterium]|nr:hypothetical protein [Candidatus Paceibacterota bacterium]MCD8528084.1 hypothetical protein [Candidatus Paceibacterota bacterium]MCD8564040.1 hypothetical protein [Candidatus Paceibacterota bacterium]
MKENNYALQKSTHTPKDFDFFIEVDILDDMNTPQKGKFRHIVFKDGDTWYAVALEFNIVESSDDPKLAFFNLLQAVSGYIQSAKKIKGSRNYSLNQETDKEYEELWATLHSSQKVTSPYVVDMYGYSCV